MRASAPSLAVACLGLSLGASSLTPLGHAAEWTHYRGPTHDGVYTGPFRTDWSVQPPTLLWRISTGPALSSLSISGGRAFTQARRPVGGEDREFAVALEAATGKELWAVNLDLADYPNGGVGNDDGPRSTPVVEGDRVYVFTTYLRLYCLDAATGATIWKRDFPAELGASVINWQNASSPVIVGDLIYVNANSGPNRLTAVRKSDGTTAWRRHDDRMTQATPIAATVAGVPQVIFFAQTGLVSVRPDNGDLLWRFAFPYSTSTAASPVVDGDLVYCSAAYSSGSGVVRVTASGTGATAAQLWKARSAHMCHWATPVAHEGYLYGVFGQSGTTLRCVETSTGTEQWKVSTVGTRELGYGSILKAGDHLLVLNESGEAVLVEPNPTAYRQLQRFQAVEGKCWNSPALNDGILYARSTTQIAAWEIAPSTPPAALQLAPTVTYAGGSVRVVVRSADGTPLPPSVTNGLSLLATDDPTQPIAAWLTLPATVRPVDGTIELEDNTAGNAPRRFYRTRQPQ